MLKNISKLPGFSIISKEKQSSINGGNITTDCHFAPICESGKVPHNCDCLFPYEINHNGEENNGSGGAGTPILIGNPL